MRIPSGTTDQVIYFVAVDATDLKTRETGLTTFTVYRSRDGAAAAAMTTPTVTEVDASNMPGVYKLLLDEDMTIGAGNDTEEMVFHVTQASMAPVTRTVELYRAKITVGQALTVASGIGEANTKQISDDATAANNLELDYDGTGYAKANSTIGTTTTNTDMRGTDSAGTATNLATVDTVVDAIKAVTDNLPNSGALTTISTDTARLTAARAAVLDDWIDAGRLDALLDTLLARLTATRAGYLDNLSAGAVALEASIAALNNITGAQAASSVWGTLLSTLTTNSTIGKRLKEVMGGEDLTPYPHIIRRATAQAGAAGTVTLDASASATNDLYNGCLVVLVSNTGAGQVRLITDYDGTTKVATIEPNWTTNPSATTTFAILADGRSVGIGGTKNTLDDLNDVTAATVNAQCDTAISDAALATAANLATVDTKLPAALVGGKMNSDATAISGSTAAADNLEASAKVIVVGAAIAGTLSTTQMSTDLTEVTDDHYIGRVIVWTSGVLLGQATDITDYTGATKVLTYTATTEAPSAADTFVIV